MNFGQMPLPLQDNSTSPDLLSRFTILLADIECHHCHEWFDLGSGLTVAEIADWCHRHECEEKK